MSWIKRILVMPVLRILLYLLLTPLIHGLLQLVLRGRVGAILSYSVAAVLAYLVVGRVFEGRDLSEMGLGRRHMARDLLAGFALTALLISLVIGALALGGWYRVEAVRWDGALVAIALLEWLRVSLWEEMLVRGILFRSMEEPLGSWLALLVSALFFGVAHGLNPGATWVSTAALVLEAGILLGAAYMLTRSLWLAIGMHWGWNFMQGTVFGAAVSGNNINSLIRPVIEGPEWATGGAFGPEAGLFGLLAGLGAGLLVLGLAVRGGQVRPPAWRSYPEAATEQEKS